ncbi:MAG TPA: MOSC N-terminal beta barrel domain-containing protein [Pyrinomonadaceae bacterium]
MFLSAINIYPIKSLKGITLNEAKIERRGLQYDRRWMLVDKNNKFFTQREFPKMATIKVEFEASGLKIDAVNKDPLFIPFDAKGTSTAEVQIWKNVCSGDFVSAAADRWFSETLDTDCRLVHMPDETLRPVDPDFAVADDIVSFADAYPFLVLTEASLSELNSRLVQKVEMNRFRPNFVISGAAPFAEDNWKRVTIGETEFHVAKPCARCVMTTVDQERGVKNGDEPLRTLASFRTVQNKVLFGQNLIAMKAGAIVRVGDEVRVVG